MASSSVNDQFLDTHSDQSLDPLDIDDGEDNGSANDNERMVRIGDLQTYQPPILSKDFHETQDRQILEEMYSSSQITTTRLQKSDSTQAAVQTLCAEASLCDQEDGSEDDWSYLVVWPMLQLAREISGLKHEVRVLPLQNTSIGPKTLLPRAPNGTVVDRRVDFGLVVQLCHDQINQILQIDQTDQDHGISPTVSYRLRNCPLFCSIEVKKRFQQYDPLVQLGVWTSAIYARWEQFQAILNTSSQEFPTLFGWSITGHLWLLHVIRRLPDGTRQITNNFREYSTRSTHDIYLILATLCELMNRGRGEFRTQFSASILNSTALSSVSVLAPALSPAPIRTSPRRKTNI